VHHKHTGFDDRAFAGLEYHRTDGQFGRSAPLDNFDIRFFFEAQGTRTRVGDLDLKGQTGAKVLVAIIDFLLIHCDGWRASAVATQLGKQERGGD
jgi:hypothetical protein